MSNDAFIFGDWQVNPTDNSLINDASNKVLEPKAMDVLVRLCREPGEVISADALLEQCWGNAPMGDNPVHKAINQLRRALGDAASNPSYIETIRKRGYRTVASVRYLAAEKSPAGHWQQGSPFAGLSAFGPDQAEVFYGRAGQIETLLERVVAQVEFGRAFCLVLGRSGSGKSSLIQAGLMPALAQPGGYQGVRQVTQSAIDLADVSSEHFWLEVASALLDWDVDDLPVFDQMSAEQIAQQLQSNDGIADLLSRCGEVIEALSAEDQTPLLVLFVDRLEVLLADERVDAQTQDQFINVITAFSESGSILVLSACRNDFYPQLASHRGLMAGKASGAHFDLAPPSRAEIMDMIRLPAQAAGLTWETDPVSGSGLDELICTQASASDDVLPMLQYTLQELYLQRRDQQLTIDSYQSMGGLEGALSQKAEAMMAELSEQAQSSLPRILSLLINLGIDETSITSRTARWSELVSEQEHSLVQALVDQRLFVSHIMNGDPSFSVAHEALLRHWPRALDWIEQHRDSLKTKTRLTQLALRWKEESSSSSYLLSAGKPLLEAQSLASNPLFELPALERSFISQSAKRARHKQWARSAIAVALVGLTLISLFMAQQGKRSQELAQQKRIEAESLLGFMVGEFAQKLRTVGRMDLLDGISNKALEYFVGSDSNNAGLNFTARLQHAQTMEAIGEVALSRSKKEEAQEALGLAQTMFKKLLQEHPDNFDLLTQLGANAFWLSTIPFGQSDYQRAEFYVKQYLHYSQSMYRLQPDNLTAIQELSYANNTLGSLAHRRNDFTTAQDYFLKSLILKRRALEALPDNVLALSDLASTYSWLASTALSMGDAQASIEYLDLEQSTFDRLSSFNHQNAQADFEQALSFYRQALLLKYQQHYETAQGKIAKSEQILRSLVQSDPENTQWQITAHRVRLLQLLIEANTNPAIAALPASKHQLDRSEAFVLQMLDSTEDSANQALLSLLLELNETTQALGLWSRSASLQDVVDQHLGSAESGGDSSLRLLQANRLLSAAALSHQQGTTEPSQAYCRRALEVTTSLSERSSSPEYLVPHAKALDCLERLQANHSLNQRLAQLGIPPVSF
ncbi:MAG: winged helix-turn-helix domain-containing protein [Cellvibrionaceae bacterium]